ncbi:MAG TPA: hypothetical protein VGG39_05035 [Polyangiaceae bacterium]|jgi:hypothetical protein
MKIKMVVVDLELPPNLRRWAARLTAPAAMLAVATVTLAANPPASHVAAVRPSFFHVDDFGAKVDGQTVTDASMAAGSRALSSAAARWARSDVGKLMIVQGAGPHGSALATTITAVLGPGACQLAEASSTGVGAARIDWGSDDRAAIDAAIAAASAANRVTSTVQLGSGTSIVSAPIAIDLGAGAAGITLRGVGYNFQGSHNYSRIASGAPMSATVVVKTLGLHMSDLWIDGNDLANNSLVVGYLTSDLDAERISVSGAVPDTGSEVFIPGTLEVDNVSFRRFKLYHDPRSLGAHEKSLANFRIANSNAFNVNLEHGEMWDGAYGAMLIAGGANIKHCQIFGNSRAMIRYESIQASSFDDIYTERQDGIPFLSEGNGTATNVDAPVLVKDCIINSRSDIDANCKQPLILDGNRLGGSVNIVPAEAPPGGSGRLGIFHVIDRATSFAVAGGGFTGDLAMLEQVGTTVAGRTDPKYGYFITSPEQSANSSLLTRVARSLQGSETISPRIVEGSSKPVTYEVDAGGPDAWVVSRAPAGARIVLPLPSVGRVLRITDGTGAAAARAAIVVVPHGRERIDGTSSYTLSTNWGSVTLFCADGSDWVASK